jgi:hypothetical protein
MKQGAMEDMSEASCFIHWSAWGGCIGTLAKRGCKDSMFIPGNAETGKKPPKRTPFGLVSAVEASRFRLGETTKS